MKSKPLLTFSGSRLKRAITWEKFTPSARWVEDNVTLSSESSAISGAMKIMYTPHLYEMYADFDRPEVWMQVLKVSSQTSKTTYLFSLAAKVLDTEPAPAQLMIPTAQGIPRYLTKKLNPFMNGVKGLKSKMVSFTTAEKLRDRGAELRVAGGGLSVTGSSRGERKSLSIKYFFGDELAEFEEGAITESMERTKTYERFFRKIVLASTMESSVDEISRVYDDCEVHKEFEIACPHCNEYFYPTSKDLQYMKFNEYMADVEDREKLSYSDYKTAALKTVHVQCPNSGCKILTKERDDQLFSKKIRWNIVKGSADGVTIGYKTNALAMYFTTFESIAELLINAEPQLNKSVILDKIYRGYFNEFYEEERETVSKNDILLLSNKLEAKTVPVDTYKLYLTIDTQKNGFWFKVTAVEYGMRFNTVYHGYVETFDELELLMGYRFQDQNGKTYIVDKTMIDRMGIKERTAEVDAWIEDLIVNQGLEGRIYPSMGIQNDASGRLWYYTTITKDVTSQDRKTTPIQAVKINNTLVKNELQSIIDRSIKRAKGEDGYEVAENRLYFVNETIVQDAENRDRSISTDYERQMTSEHYIFKVDSKTGKVATTKTWEKRNDSIDNHLFDNAVQAVVCALMDNVSLAQKPSKNDLKDALDILGFN